MSGRAALRPVPPLPGRRDAPARVAPVDALTSHLVAHRGLHDDAIPENSLAAFAAAVIAGYAVECDVHVTLEGEAVVFHDNSLTRMCQRSEAIERLTRSVRPLTRLSTSDQYIPTLREVLDIVDGQVPVFVDLRFRNSYAALRRGAWQSLCEAVGVVLAGYPGPVGVMSWDPRQLRWFREHHPQVLRIQSGGVVAGLPLLPGVAGLFDNLRLARFSTPHAISFNGARLPRTSVARARAAGLPVFAWTVRSQTELDGTLRHADTAIFEGFRPTETDPALRRPPARRRRRHHRIGEAVTSLRRGWSAMGWSERLALGLTALGGIVLARLLGHPGDEVGRVVPAVTLLAAAALAAWQPRRWWLIGSLLGGWAPLVALVTPGPSQGRFLAPVLAVVGATFGAAIRAVRPPRAD